MEFVSLFSGGGGLDLGLEMAGWTCRYASDIDPVAVDTLKANRELDMRNLREALIERCDAREARGRKILSSTGLKKGQVSLLAGGPPCQSWSSAGHQQGFNDPRGLLFDEYIRLARELDARWLLLENVRGLLTARGPEGHPGEALKHVRAALLSAGWQTRVDLLNAADFGVAQRRVRLFLLGYRAGDPPPFPQSTHAQVPDVFTSGWISLGECLSRIAPPSPSEVIRPSGKLLDDLRGVEPGSGVKSPGKKESTRPGGHWGYKQGAFVADLDLPARTVTANSQQDWILDERLGLRRLAPRECAAIQSFPSDWTFCGSKADQYRLIGNAVPPVLAKHIGRELLRHAEVGVAAGSTVIAQAPHPLPKRLAAAIEYTMREEAVNGHSRRSAPVRRARSRQVA